MPQADWKRSLWQNTHVQAFRLVLKVVDNEAVSEQTPSYNLKFYRKLNGLTQKELADELSIAKQYVSNMETGERSISRQMAKNLAEIFKVSPARFI